MSTKFKYVMNDWAKSNPGWHEDLEMSEKFIDMMNIYMREPDEDKCIHNMYKKIHLDKN